MEGGIVVHGAVVNFMLCEFDHSVFKKACSRGGSRVSRAVYVTLDLGGHELKPHLGHRAY